MHGIFFLRFVGKHGKQSPIKVYLNIFIGIKLKWEDERNGKIQFFWSFVL